MGIYFSDIPDVQQVLVSYFNYVSMFLSILTIKLIFFNQQSTLVLTKLKYDPKLYIPSTINIWKKVLTKAIYATKKWTGFWQISLYIK